jgi:hypothetical protein
MSAVHEEMHQGARKQEQVWQDAQEMGAMFFPIHGDGDAEKSGQENPPGQSEYSAISMRSAHGASRFKIRYEAITVPDTKSDIQAIPSFVLPFSWGRVVAANRNLAKSARW